MTDATTSSCSVTLVNDYLMRDGDRIMRISVDIPIAGVV